MPNSIFKFKQFTINQDKCSMKVGTDSVLLGSWVDLNNVLKVLDVGTGTGLLSLMVAQRSNSEIVSIDIDEFSYIQSIENFNNSTWGNRITSLNISFQDYLLENSYERFDLIISNPPYFNNSFLSEDLNRNIARQNLTLSLLELIKISKELLTEKGKLCFIVPYNIENYNIINSLKDFFINNICFVSSKKNLEPIRMLVEMSKQVKEVRESRIYIEEENRHQYSLDYINLTKDFYLKM